MLDVSSFCGLASLVVGARRSLTEEERASLRAARKRRDEAESAFEEIKAELARKHEELVRSLREFEDAIRRTEALRASPGEIAREVGITRSRVYQIRDGGRGHGGDKA